MRDQPLILDNLQFHADRVAGHEEEYADDFIVHGIYFGEGDPEQGGQHWNFTRSLNDDDGVCTVKEIQEFTLYGGINQLRLSRKSLICQFDGEAAQTTLTRKVTITYEVNDEIWEALVTQAKLVFQGEPYFNLVL